MKIAAVSMVKDECDIIELFVRINARAIDHFFILDNGSSDSTCRILEQLRADGFPVTISHDAAIGYPQDKITTNLIKEVAKLEQFDWIFPLDADEFVQADKAQLMAELIALPAESCAVANWATFVPVSDQYFSFENPLWSCFKQRAAELRQYGKVIIPVTLAGKGAVTMGNHSFRRDNKKVVPTHVLATRLAHVPVRSSSQLVSKAIVGSHKFSIKANRRPGEGFHWDAIADKARANDYKFDYLALKEVALSYGLNSDDIPSNDLLLDTHIGTSADKILYPEWAEINLSQRNDRFMAALCDEIRRFQKQRKRIFFFSRSS